MKFVLALYSGSYKPEDHGIARSWYVAGQGDGARWSPKFDAARQMTLDEAVEVYQRMDSPMRKLGLVPVE
jgi:hypothetical protein